MSTFTPATRTAKRARVAISGPSGSGKTRAALEIATGIGGGVAVVDSENRSSELYADKYSFDVAHLSPPFTPARYLDLMRAADESPDYAVTVIDSGSHAWAGDGGVLAMADAARAQSRNKFAAWSEPTKAHNAFLTGIVFAANHVVMTLRSRMKYAQDPDTNEVTRVGFVPIQRGEFEYEFDLHLDLGHDHTATVMKSRLDSFPVGSTLAAVTAEHGERLALDLAGQQPGTLAVLDPYMVKAQGRLAVAVKLWILDRTPGDGDERKANARRTWVAALTDAGLDPDADEDMLQTSAAVAIIEAIEANE